MPPPPSATSVFFWNCMATTTSSPSRLPTNRLQTDSLDSSRHPLSVHLTASGMQSSYAQPEFKPAPLPAELAPNLTIDVADVVLARQPQASNQPPRRKVSGKGHIAISPDYQVAV